MPKLIVPLVQEYSISSFKHRDRARRIKPNDPLIVKFRQATELDNITRQQLLSEPITRQWIPEEEEEELVNGSTRLRYQEQTKLTPFSYRMAVDCYLTMVFCNIETPKGDLLFDIPANKSAYQVYGSIREFLTDWGKLFPEWANLIHAKCLICNPSWGIGNEEDVDQDDDDEETMTLGEGDISGVAGNTTTTFLADSSNSDG
jgi:hypothetical protein